jgi:ABC-2 type transport system permease protein
VIDLINAEWIKFVSLRGSWIRLGVALALAMATLTVGLIFFNRSVGDGSAATEVTDRIDLITSGVGPASLLLVILGVIVFTAEIKSRTIIPTMSAAPDRGSIVMSKSVLVILVAAGFAIVVGGLSLAVGLVGLDQQGFTLDLDDTHFVRVIVGAGAYLVIAALFGLGIGVLTNSTTFGVALGLIWPTAIEGAILGFAPDWIDKFLPFQAGNALYATPEGDIPPWEGGAIFLIWAVALLLVGTALFNRRNLGSS